jgi:hypothetical protein
VNPRASALLTIPCLTAGQHSSVKLLVSLSKIFSEPHPSPEFCHKACQVSMALVKGLLSTGPQLPSLFFLVDGLTWPGHPWSSPPEALHHCLSLLFGHIREFLFPALGHLAGQDFTMKIMRDQVWEVMSSALRNTSNKDQSSGTECLQNEPSQLLKTASQLKFLLNG